MAYDIIDNRRRLKIANSLENYGTRVQYSVFECILDQAKFDEMAGFLMSLIDPAEDSLRFYILCEGCFKKIQVSGTAEIVRDQEVFII